jgi:hypothetical protein
LNDIPGVKSFDSHKSAGRTRRFLAFSQPMINLLLAALTGEGCGLALCVSVELQDIHSLDEIVLNGIDMPQLGV